MNGNELANVLRWPKGEEYQHEWYAGQQLPKEWWKTDFPYGEAERMGYRLSGQELETFRKRQGEQREPKSLSDELADILRRPEVKMLDPLQRANLIETIQKAQAAIAKREEEREKHETEMLTIGKETQLRERVQAILQSDRVPAQKVTALTMAGVPLSDARDMVWGKRAPEAEERPAREAAPRARAAPTGEELVEGLRPERRGVQFRMVGGELIKERAGIWEEERLTPEQKIAKREAGLKEAEYYRGRALEREGVVEKEEIKKQKVENARKIRVINAVASAVEGTMSLPVLATILEGEGYSTDIIADYIGKPLTELEKADLTGKKLENAIRFADYHRELAVKRERPEMFVPLEERKFDEEVRQAHEDYEKWEVERGDEQAQALLDNAIKLAQEKRDARKAEREESAEARGLAVKRAYPELFIPLEERQQWWEEDKWKEEVKEDKRRWEKDFGAERAQEMFDNLMTEREYFDGIRQIEAEWKRDAEKYGDERADKMKEWRLKEWEAVNAHKKDLWDMGFKDRDFVETKAQWWADFYKTKKDKKEEARQFNVTEERLLKEEANRVREFEEKLKKQYKDLDLEVKKYGLTRDVEARIAKMALWNFVLDWQKLGHDGALLKWEEAKEEKKYWWKEKEIGLKNLQAFTSFMGAMDKIIGNAKTSDNLWELVNKVLGDSLGEDYVGLIKVLNKEGKAQIEIPEELSVALDDLPSGQKDNVMECFKAAYNTKTGEWHIPNQSRMKNIGAFFLGEVGIEPKELKLDKLGCNLSFEEFCDKVLQEPFWSDADKGAVIRMRVDPQIAQGLLAKAKEKGVLISPADVTKPSLWDKITGWWPFGKGKKEPTEIDFPAMKAEVDRIYDETGSIRPVTEYLESMGITLDKYKEWLRGK